MPKGKHNGTGRGWHGSKAAHRAAAKRGLERRQNAITVLHRAIFVALLVLEAKDSRITDSEKVTLATAALALARKHGLDLTVEMLDEVTAKLRRTKKITIADLLAERGAA